jgi:hypothetical protein
MLGAKCEYKVANYPYERADDWRSPWPGYTCTRYEEKALRAGRQPCYLVFRRVG